MKNGPQEVDGDFVCVCERETEGLFSVLFKKRQRTHHLHVVGIEGLFIQGEFLRTEGVVELNHLRKLQAERKHDSQTSLFKQWRAGEAREKLLDVA